MIINHPILKKTLKYIERFYMLKPSMLSIKHKLFQIKIAFWAFFSFFNCVYSQHYSSSDIDSILINENEKLRLTGKKKELILLNQKFINISQKQDYVKGEALGYINIGNIYATIGAYNNSLHYLQLAENKIKTTNDFYLHSRLYLEYGQYNYVIGLESKALIYNTMAIHYGNQITEPAEKKILSNIYANRADFLYHKGPADSSLIYLQKALKIKPSPVINCLIANHYLNYKKKPDSSTYYINRALLMLKKIDYWNIQRGMSYYYCGNYYSKNKDYKKALDYYKKSIDILEKTKRIYTTPHLYKTIAETYKLVKDEDRERIYLEKYTHLKDSLNQVWNKTINLSVDQAINEKDLQVTTKKNTVLVYNVIIGCLMVTALLFFWFNYKKHNISRQKPEVTDQINNTDDIKNTTEPIKTEELDQDLIKLAQENSPLFISKFQEIHPELIKKIRLINPKMSKSELSLCAMIWLGFSSKDIAHNTFMQHRSVQTKKHRLRKKLNIPSEIDLYIFFKDL